MQPLCFALGIFIPFLWAVVKSPGYLFCEFSTFRAGYTPGIVVNIECVVRTPYERHSRYNHQSLVDLDYTLSIDSSLLTKDAL